jgi:hypothetical protein
VREAASQATLSDAEGTQVQKSGGAPCEPAVDGGVQDTAQVAQVLEGELAALRAQVEAVQRELALHAAAGGQEGRNGNSTSSAANEEIIHRTATTNTLTIPTDHSPEVEVVGVRMAVTERPPHNIPSLPPLHPLRTEREVEEVEDAGLTQEEEKEPDTTGEQASQGDNDGDRFVTEADSSRATAAERSQVVPKP